MKKLMFVACCLSLLQLKPLKAFAEIDELIRFSFAKDGGTRCLKFTRSDKEVLYCIDHKMWMDTDRKIRPGSGDIFFGGRADSPTARKLNNEELKSLNNEILRFMKTEKYKNFSKKEYKSASRERMTNILNSKPHDGERYKKLQAYDALESFRAELARKIK